jgi:ABC-type transport system involved in cytochrome bd biosynthesis fused ATPase/permease subunit
VNTRDITSVVTLLLIGFLASFFTKNMAILLSIALVFTWLLKYAMKLRHEGFEGQEEEEKKDHDKDQDQDQHQDSKKETMTDKESSESDKSSDKEKEKELKALKKDYESFEEIQKNILGGVKEINKELDKAETFINKYEQYKNKHGKKSK